MPSPRRVQKKPPQPVGHSVLNLSTYAASPRYTFQPPHREVPGLKVPGPGSYEGAPKSPGHSATLTSRRECRPREEVPGPGTHDARTRMGSGPKYSVVPPRGAKTPAVPGPGAYEHSSPMGTGPKYSICVPREGRKNKVPGPGEYEHADASVLAHNPQWTMATSQRQKQAMRAETPGPGTHKKETTVGEGPKFTHGVPRKERITVTPGPGEYGGHYTTFHM